MIIDKTFWTTSAKSVLPVSAGFSWEKVEPRLNDAWMQWFLPLFGSSVCQLIEEVVAKEDITEEEYYLIYWSRRALCNLCFWQFFDELGVRVTDQGFQRQESDSFKSLYKYERDTLKQNYKNTGFNSLEQVISLCSSLFKKKEVWQSSPCFIMRRKKIVQSKQDVTDVFDIHDSYLIYLALRVDFHVVETTIIPARLGNKLYEALMKAIREGAETINDSVTTEEFRQNVAKVVVTNALLRFFERYGTLTDRGYFYSNYKAVSENNMEAKPVSADMRQVTMDQIKRDLAAYEANLDAFIEEYLQDYREAAPSSVYTRDNDHKHTFFA